MTTHHVSLEATWQYFANAAGAVRFVPNAYVYLQWHGSPMDSPELHALYVHARNLLQRQGLCCILADHRQMPAITEADRQWLLTQWLPETVALTGYSHCAVLRAPSPTGRLHTDHVVECMQQFVKIEIFDDLLTADQWLHLVLQAAGR